MPFSVTSPLLLCERRQEERTAAMTRDKTLAEPKTTLLHPRRWGDAAAAAAAARAGAAAGAAAWWCKHCTLAR